MKSYRFLSSRQCCILEQQCCSIHAKSSISEGIVRPCCIANVICGRPGTLILKSCVHAGAVFIQVMQQQLDKFGDVKFESLTGANARKTVLVIGIMAAHAVGEGCGVGVSFCGSRGWAQVRRCLQHCTECLYSMYQHLRTAVCRHTSMRTTLC